MLDTDQIAAYRRDGFVVIPGTFGADDVASCVEDCERLEASGVIHPDNLRTHVLNSDRPPDRLDPVIDLAPALRALTESPCLGAAANQLLGDRPALFKDKLIFKPPGMRGYKTHQDYAYWHWLPAPADALLTVLVSLDAANEENGALELFPGLHDRQLSPEGAPGDIDEDILDVTPRRADTRPGDVVIFHSLTPHRSGDNRSATKRRQLYLSYSAAEYGDLYRTYYDGLHQSVRAGMPPEVRERSYFL